jgi:hypothetical protein
MFHRMVDSMVDSLEAVFAFMDDSGACTPDKKTHLIHLEAFFFCPGRHWPCHQFEKMCFCRSNFGNSQSHDFGGRFGPYGRA